MPAAESPDSRSQTPALPKPKPLATATSELPPAPAPLPSPSLDWADIAKKPNRWPPQTRIKKPVDFPIVVGGRTSGSARAPEGTAVRVVKITGDGVEIAYGEFRAKIAVDQTTLDDQMMEAKTELGQKPQTEDLPRGPKLPKPSPAPTQQAGKTMVPQTNWQLHVGSDLASSTELLKVIGPYTEADASLEVSQYPEIYRGVTLMMPLRDALKKLGLEKEAVPSKSPISHPGIPFFFRPFPNKLDPGAGRADDASFSDASRSSADADSQAFHLKPQEPFNLLYIVTDAADRVLGIEFVCESPSILLASNTDFSTYNFVLNRRKMLTNLKVRCDMKRIRGDVLVIETRLIDEPRHKCLEIVRWYLPKRVANFIHHAIKAQLNLPE